MTEMLIPVYDFLQPSPKAMAGKLRLCVRQGSAESRQLLAVYPDTPTPRYTVFPPRVTWVNNLQWFEVDTLEDLEKARKGLVP